MEDEERRKKLAEQQAQAKATEPALPADTTTAETTPTILSIHGYASQHQRALRDSGRACRSIADFFDGDAVRGGGRGRSPCSNIDFDDR